SAGIDMASGRITCQFAGLFSLSIANRIVEQSFGHRGRHDPIGCIQHFTLYRRLGHAPHEWRFATVMPLRHWTYGNCHRCKGSQSAVSSFSLGVPTHLMKGVIVSNFSVYSSQRQSQVCANMNWLTLSAIRTNCFANVVEMRAAEARINPDPECLVHDSVAVC